jgi:hypothetical protein
VWIVDDTGFIKKGVRSAGVARQYTGTSGKIDNCQLRVFLAYGSARGQALVDRELYLPPSWTEDADRCAAAGVEAQVGFATKPQLGVEMLARAHDAGVLAGWVTADEAFGQNRVFRGWLGAVASVESKVRQAWSMRRRCRRVPALRSSFAGFRFPPDVIIIAVRWYLRYSLSYRDVEELLAERGITVDHVTVYRWVQRFTPLLIDAARPCRHTPGDRWFVDETYVKVSGRWVYLYRAIDQFG